MHASSSKGKGKHSHSSDGCSATRKTSAKRKKYPKQNFLGDMELESDPEVLDDGTEGDSVGLATGKSGWPRTQEVPNRYVSQEELDALKGCVTRRRAIFSPSPLSSPLCSRSPHKPRPCQQHAPGYSNSLPVRGKHVMVDNKLKHRRQGSFEYDHLADFNPYTASTGNISESISVQFNFQMNERCEVYCGTASQHSQRGCNHTNIKCRSPSTNNIPELLSAEANFGYSSYPGEYGPIRTPFSEPQGVERVHENSEEMFAGAVSEHCGQRRHSEATSQGSAADLMSYPLTKASSVHLGSPYHTKFNSPLLSKHQCHEGFHGLHRSDHTGSNFSLYSQTTTASSLTDRPHCSYSKGVDVSQFKERHDVSTRVLCYLGLH